MENLVAAVLIAALGYGGGLEAQEVAFTNLPPVCAAAYNEDLRELRGGIVRTEVVRLDMDHDGSDELLVWDGNAGSGGQGWYVFTKTGAAWRKAGEVFGDPIKVARSNGDGLLVSSPCGWSLCNFDYYELEKGTLAKKLAFEVSYAKPDPQTSVLRDRPTNIKITHPTDR